MKKQNSQRGAISVFLVIILIPCIAFSSMFVDLSRVKLAQGVATSASDLALNSLMTNYDKDLSEYYGLMGSCQNIEEFYDVAAQCFLDALYSQGLNADDAESLLAYVGSFFAADEVHDLFQMEVETETKDIISAFKGTNKEEASLGTSSVIIKDQVVEFMKYRAPIEITSNIIERLKNSGASSVFETAEEDEILTDDKQKYAEAEEGFMEAAHKTYKALVAYEKIGFKNDSIKTMLSDMKAARETYREITTLMVSNLNGTSGLKQFTRPAYGLDQYKYTEASTKVHSRQEKDKSGNKVYYINASKIEKLLKELNDNIEDFKKKRKAVSDAVGSQLINADIGTGANQYNAIQWWKKVNSLLGSTVTNFDTAAKKMLESYSKVLAIKKCKLDKDVTKEWETQYNSLTQSVVDLQSNYLTAGAKGNGSNSKNAYLILVNKLEKVSKDNKNKVNEDKVKLKNGKTVNRAVKDVDTQLSNHVKTLDDAIAKLDTLIDGTLFNNPYSLDELGKKADEYHKSYKKWKNNAKDQVTDLEKSDWKSIQEGEKKGEILDTSKSEISDFKTRLVDVRARLKDVKSTINSMKFGTKKLVDIDKYSTAYNAVKSDIGENLTNSAVSSKASSLFKSKFSPYTADTNAEVKTYSFSDKYNPVLTVSQPKFHFWLTKKFEGLDETELKKEKDKVDGKEKEGDDAKKAAENEDADRTNSTVSKTNLYNNKSYKGADFPSELDAKGKFSLAGSLISNVGDLVSSLVKMNFDSTRDALYSTEYVMDMFSYATYEYEGKYNLYKDKYSAAPKKVADYSKVKDEWKSEKKTDKYNQTLTNFKINSDNNILYNAEAEYVLYGNTNKKNLASAYVDIYGIRYALNTLSGFQNFWTPLSCKPGSSAEITAKAIQAAASAISSATSGIVPIPVIKCVAILLITALESVNDLTRLCDGFPVEIYKTGDQWAYSIGGKDLATDKKDITSEKGLFYSDYIYMFLCLGFKNESSASEMYRRIGDLIQVNMRKYTGKSDYKLKNARTYFQVKAKIRIKPLMLDLPINFEYGNGIKDASGWCTFEVSDTRGYS